MSIILIIFTSAVAVLSGVTEILLSNDDSSTIDLKDDEEVLFFPTYAYKSKNDGGWIAHVHGWIYEPERDSIKRRALIRLVGSSIGVDLSKEDNNTVKIFRSRAHYFLVDQEGGKRISVNIADRVINIGRTDKNGHAQRSIEIDKIYINNRSMIDRRGHRYIVYHTRAVKNPARSFTQKVRIIGERGISVISDIDDTIKITGVVSKKSLLRNTFLKPFKPVPGMPKLFRNLEKRGAVFHYLSASPWQLFQPLSEFIDKEQFPRGFFHMKYFGVLKNLSNLFSSSELVKEPYISQLMKQFPLRTFVLVGDSGEKDPEIYGNMARQWPDRIHAIIIRNVTDEKRTDKRFKKAFKGIAEDKWFLFKRIEEIDLLLLKKIDKVKIP